MLLVRSFKNLKLIYHSLCRSIVLWLYFFKTWEIDNFLNMKKKLKHCLEFRIIIVMILVTTRKIQPDNSRVNERPPFSGPENFRTNVYYSILDTLSVQLAGRKSAYETLYQHFNFFDDLCEIDTNELKNVANKLVNKYPDYLEETLGNECIHFQYQLKDSLAKIEDAMYCIPGVFEMFIQMWTLLSEFFEHSGYKLFRRKIFFHCKKSKNISTCKHGPW